MTNLSQVYSGHTTDKFEVHTMEIAHPSQGSIYTCHGYVDYIAQLETVEFKT